MYKITHKNKKYLYPCKNEHKDNYNHKKLHLNTEDLACIRNSKNTQMVDYTTFNKMDKGDDFSTSMCGLNDLLNKNKSDFINTRNDFDIKFKNLLNSYNALSESELKILKETDIKVEDLTNLLTDYKKLIKKSNKYSDLIDTTEQQTKNSNEAYKQIQYTNAIVGIGALAAAIGCFHYMKK